MTLISTTIYRVRIAVPERGGMGDIPALLDMLRYEGGRIAAWNNAERRGQPVIVVTIASEQYVPDRWASFGITPEVAS